MPKAREMKRNQLLAALPDDEWKRWSASLERVEMSLGEVLYEPGVALNYVYFPITSIVSLLYVMENGASAEIAVVGNEGLSAFRYSWAAIPRPVAPSYKVPASAADSSQSS